MIILYVLIALAAAFLVALYNLNPLFWYIVQRTVLRRPALHIKDLPDLFNGQHFNIEHPQKKPDADKSLWTHDDKTSIIYHRSTNADVVTETVYIACRDKFGMILTLKNNTMTRIERITGVYLTDPELDDAEKNALTRFMVKLRDRLTHA